MPANNSTIPIPDATQTSDEFVISEDVRIILFTLILTMSFFGIVSNIINIIVFYKLQGGDPININLLGLAVSDLLICLTTFVFIISTAYWIIEDMFRKYKIFPVEVVYIIIGVPHSIFVRISILITALISFERCMCVVLPLKVKMLINHARVKLSVVLSFLLGSLVAIPNYYVNRLEWVYVPSFNTSFLRHAKTDQFYDVNYWFTPLDGICLYIFPFVVVTVCTVVMIKGLKRTMRFRLSITRPISAERNPTTFREKKIVNMVVIISVVFLTCNFPNIIAFLIVAFDLAGVSLEDSDTDLVKLVGLIPIILDTFNASINILIYYTNSSNYKDMFKTIFRLRRRRKE